MRADGAVACWGDNFFEKATPPEGEFVSVSAGYAHSCEVRVDGYVACWGQTFGEVGSQTSGGGLHLRQPSGNTHYLRSEDGRLRRLLGL